MRIPIGKIALLSAFLATALAVSAQPTGGQNGGGQNPGGGQSSQRPTTAQLIEQMDSNKDSKLSKSEVQGPLKQDFSRVDSNKDGYLTSSEIEAGAQGAPQGSNNGSSSQR